MNMSICEIVKNTNEMIAHQNNAKIVDVYKVFNAAYSRLQAREVYLTKNFTISQVRDNELALEAVRVTGRYIRRYK